MSLFKTLFPFCPTPVPLEIEECQGKGGPYPAGPCGNFPGTKVPLCPLFLVSLKKKKKKGVKGRL